MLGSLSEADNAVQESGCGSAAPTPTTWSTWAAGLTTVVARLSLDMLADPAPAPARRGGPQRMTV
ncbi:MAG: hypothetical protein WKF73_09495 [Nocardioidaceae bacterium]